VTTLAALKQAATVRISSSSQAYIRFDSSPSVGLVKQSSSRAF